MAAIAFQGGVAAAAAAAEAQPSSTSCSEASCAEDSPAPVLGAVLLQHANTQGVGVNQSGTVDELNDASYQQTLSTAKLDTTWR